MAYNIHEYIREAQYYTAILPVSKEIREVNNKLFDAIFPENRKQRDRRDKAAAELVKKIGGLKFKVELPKKNG